MAAGQLANPGEKPLSFIAVLSPASCFMYLTASLSKIKFESVVGIQPVVENLFLKNLTFPS